MPRMSVRTATPSPSLISPIAMPAHRRLIGTPASISASELPQTVAIDDEPFDSRISETMRIVYGKSSSPGGPAGSPARRARRGRSRGAPVPRIGRTSPIENGGKL